MPRFVPALLLTTAALGCNTNAAHDCTSETARNDTACEPAATDGSSTGDTGDASDSTTGDASGSADGTSGGTSTTVAGGCESHAQCSDAAAPFCLDGECVACSDTADGNAACAELDPAAPLCDAGSCVQCTAENDAACEGETPVCDAGTRTCVGCTEHAQCGELGCDIADGSCLGGDVYEVDGDGGTPYITVAAALDALAAAGTEGTVIVHPSAAPYFESFAIPAGTQVAILAAPGEQPILQGNDTDAGTITVPANTTLYLEALILRGGSDVGLSVAGTAHVSRSSIVNNTDGGITVDGGALTLVNSMVGGSTGSALQLSSGQTTILYSSLVGGFFNGNTALTCDDGTSMTVRNSILFADEPATAVSCPEASITYSLAQTQLEGDGNVQTEQSLEVLFPSAVDGQYTVPSDSPAADVAHWQTGDPTTDFDGTPRPTTDGAPDYAGADVPE